MEQTPEMLPVLKKAGVVDAGGKGLLIVFEGMLSVLRDGIMIEDTQPKGGEGQETDDFQDAIAQYDADITFAYCTEFIVQKKEPNADSLKLRAYLESIGDSVVVVDDEDIIKCHVHTNNPGLALEEAVKYGMLCKMKIENMEEQVCRPKISGSKGKSQGRAAGLRPGRPGNSLWHRSGCAGEGLQGLFRDLGANQVVSGGQTMNPSTEDILKAIHATPAQNVFVLPNNKNIIMAAEQAH